jgi:alkanesulfonate monooxygenase SsuD/methylene tetrahydromethanopterin reductase-like flavin-dependent oxidoreductase (luciferase family)
MRFGVVFPQYEIGADPGACRAFAQAAEALGYSHILAYDHVLGADPTNRPGWRGYTINEMFHEVFVLFGFLAAHTMTIELAAGVIILPQRQTALVAKQAAEVDVLCGGRLRLGAGLGWNAVEYEALNENFHTRGARIAEQIAVMRALWMASTTR